MCGAPSGLRFGVDRRCEDSRDFYDLRNQRRGRELCQAPGTVHNSANTVSKPILSHTSHVILTLPSGKLSHSMLTFSRVTKQLDV